MQIRPYRPADLPALHSICLATAAAGADASALYCDPLLVGHVFAAPYAIHAPDCCFVLEDNAGVGGYIVGAADTGAFEDRLETGWWPDLRLLYPPPTDAGEWKSDRLMMRLIHRPLRTPARIARLYPSHLHINLLPHLQGQGCGKKLIQTWLDRMRELGSSGAHLAVGIGNSRAVEFYRKGGFRELERTGRDKNIIWFGIRPIV